MIWVEKENSLQSVLEFNDFVEAFSFMTSVAIIAEKQNHHPNWSNEYNRVSFKLSTHDAGNVVTKRDRELADSISKLASKYSLKS